MIYVKIGSGLEIITHTYCFLSTYEDSFNETLDIKYIISICKIDIIISIDKEFLEVRKPNILFSLYMHCIY